MLFRILCSMVLVLHLAPFRAELSFKMCGVRDTTNFFQNGWYHVIHYVNEQLGGLSIGDDKVNISIKDNVFEYARSADIETEWYQKWDENIAWGCQAALCQSDSVDFIETAVYLEDRGLIVMLASGTRWTKNPRTNLPWQRTWNGAISSKLYHRGFITQAAFKGAKKLCTVYNQDWIFGTSQTLNVVQLARDKYSLDVVRIAYNHSNSPSSRQQAHLASAACEQPSPSPSCETTYEEPYDTSTWRMLLEACGPADVLVAYVLEDGVSLARYMWEHGHHFKAIYMSNAPTNPNFPALTGEAGELIAAASQWSTGMVASCEVLGSNEEFTRSFRARFGREPHYMEALTAFDAVLVLLSAQMQASVDEDKVNDGIQALDGTETFFGRVQWGLRNMQGRDPLLLQVLRGELTVVEPKEVAEENFAFPIPTQEARSGCPAGTYEGKEIMIKRVPNVTECVPCQTGRYSAKARISSPLGCLRCGVGKYSDVEGSSECISCPTSGGNLMTTSFESAQEFGDCRCADGFYRTALGRVCVSCPSGMVCPPGADAAEGAAVRPLLQPLYWSDPSDSFSVFRCQSKNRCPGGTPGSCGPKLSGIACSFCVDDWVWSESACERCSGLDSSVFVFPIVPLLLIAMVFLGTYLLFRDMYESWDKWNNGIASAAFVLINHYQVTTLFMVVNVMLPYSFEATLKVLAVTSDVLIYFRPECVGFTSFESRLIIKTLLLPLSVIVIALFFWGISHAVSRLSNKSAVAMDVNRALNSVSSLIFTFFTGIAALAFQLFKCSPNPNGKSTLATDRGIICYESDWIGMVAISVVAVLLWCVGFGALLCSAIWNSSKHFHEHAFSMRWKFLFIKYRPELRWWALAILTKSILLNLSCVVASEAVVQIYAMVSIIVIYAALAAVFWPWRHVEVNIVDIWAHLCLAVSGATMVRFAEDGANKGESLDTVVGNYGIVWVFLIVPVAAVVGVFLYYEAKSKMMAESKLTKERLIFDANERLSLLSEEKIQDFLHSLTDWDFHFLVRAQQVIHTELAGMRCRQGYASMKLRTIREFGSDTHMTEAKVEEAGTTKDFLPGLMFNNWTGEDPPEPVPHPLPEPPLEVPVAVVLNRTPVEDVLSETSSDLRLTALQQRESTSELIDL